MLDLKRSKPLVLCKPQIIVNNQPHATGDFETRSQLDVTKTGPWLYASHQSTQALCFAYRMPGQKTVLWHRAHSWCKESPPPVDLFDFIKNGGLIEAHNQFFEECIWHWVMTIQHDWPAVPVDQWRCSAAKASSHAWPRKLEHLAAAMGTKHQKDMEGHKIMLRVSRPLKITKKLEKEYAKRGETIPKGPIWNEDENLIRRTWAYCIEDTETEHECSSQIPDLSPTELKVWQINQECNRVGVNIDTDLCESALKMFEQAKIAFRNELKKLTGIDGPGRRALIKDWLNSKENLGLADTQAKTIDWYLRKKEKNPKFISDRAARVLQIVRQANRISIKKYQTMLDLRDPIDGKVRELIQYCGAERTGRFAGKGIQVHNFPKGDLGKKIDDAVKAIKKGDLEYCEVLYGDAIEVIVGCLRGAIIPEKKNQKLFIADYAAIEARVVLWLAGAIKALEVFKKGGDIYCDMASAIYGYKVTPDMKDERQFGKQAILGLGYGMGWLKFFVTCRGYNISFTQEQVKKILGGKYAKYIEWVEQRLFPNELDFDDPTKYRNARAEARRFQKTLIDERENPKDVIFELALCKFVVDTYRARYPEVPEFWKAIEDAALNCARTKKPTQIGRLKFHVNGRYLYMDLPSKVRSLAYVDFEVKGAKTSWGETKLALRYMGIDQKTRKWVRQATYGGKLTENAVQAIARDIMAQAMIRLDEEYGDVLRLLMTVHDELVAQGDPDDVTRDEYEACVAQCEPWFKSCPIAAEAGIAERYRK